MADIEILTGSGAPSDSLGVDGNQYYDISTGHIYGPKSSGSWGIPSHVVQAISSGLTSEISRATAVESTLEAAQAALAPLSGKNSWSSDQYFKSGRPWYDVTAYGADPSGVADSTAGIQAAINAACGLRTDTNVGFTASSTTVTNPAAVSGDNGKYLTSPNFGAPGYAHITAVTPGVGYTVGIAATASLSAQTATVGTAAALSGRIALGPVYLPAGLYLVSSDLIIRSTLGFHLQGAGADQVRIAPVGTAFTQAVIFIDGSLDGIYEGFAIQGNGTEGASGSTSPGIPDAIRLDWTTAASRSSSANHFKNIRVRNTNFVTGISLEGTGARQLDGTYLHDVLVTGSQVDGSWLSTGNWQSGFAFGNGTQGNIYDHVAVAVGASNCYYNFKVNCSSIALFGAQPGANAVDYYLKNPTSQCTIENVQSQTSGAFIVCDGNASLVPVSFRDIQFKGYVGRKDTGLCSTNSTTTVTDTAAVAGDLGKYICGPGIPAGATITAVTPATGYTISATATATASGVTFTIGYNPTWISTGTSYGSWVFENVTYSTTIVPTPTVISLGTGHGSYGQQFTLIGVSQPAPPSTGITTGTSVPVIAIAYSDISGGQGPGLTATYPFYAVNANALFRAGVAASRPPLASTYGEMWYWATDTNVLSHSNGASWSTVAPSPGGTAGGDLSGTFPSPTVAKLNGVTISNAPATGQALIATGTTAAAWTPFTAGLTLDTTAGDIQPLGTQAAGSTGLAADAGHVHAVPKAPDVQEFSYTGSNQTWTKPAGAQVTRLLMIGSASGGASGDRRAAGTLAKGGAGSAGGSILIREFVSSDLPSTVTVTLGVGGTGGAAQTADSTGGIAGGAGGYTEFVGYAVLIPAGSGTVAGGTAGAASATGLAGAAGGSSAAGTGGGAGGGVPANRSDTGCGTNSTTTVTDAAAVATDLGRTITNANIPANTTISAVSVGVGYTLSQSATGTASSQTFVIGAGAYVGGSATYSGSGWTSNVGVVGAIDSTLPTAGTLPTVKGTPSCGGAGGCSSVTTAAQAGATAYRGGGAGGGGASLNGNNSGAGGNGGPGYALVVSFFQ
jgi:hypothetical protein